MQGEPQQHLLTHRHEGGSSPPRESQSLFGVQGVAAYTTAKHVGADGGPIDPEDLDPKPRILDRIGWWVTAFVILVVSIALIALCAVIFGTLIADQNKKIDRLREDFLDALDALEQRLCDKIQAVADDLATLENRTDAIEEILAEGPFQPLDEKAQPDGYAPLDGNAIVPDEHLPPELEFAMFLGSQGGGCWDPRTNTPLLKSNQLCMVGEFYVSNNTGTTILDSFGGIGDPWQLGDAVVCTGDIGWKRVRDVPRVKTWNGLDGDVMAFLGSLIDVDTTGAVQSDVLHNDGTGWSPLSGCCLPLDGPVGFFATQEQNFKIPEDNDDDPNVFVHFTAWTLPGGYFNGATISQVAAGAGGFGFDTTNQLYKVPQQGWWTLDLTMYWNPETGPKEIGTRIRLFTSFVNGILVVEGSVRSNPIGNLARDFVQDINGVFPLCRGDQLLVEVIEIDDDDNSDDLVLGVPGRPHWSMWRMPDQLMPSFVCGFPLDSLNGRLSFLHRLGMETYVAEDGEQILLGDPRADAQMVYQSHLAEWQRQKMLKEWCTNCSSIEVGPEPTY